jgi:hypothetical protein
VFEDFYMPQFDADYFNSPAFQQAIAAAVQQYSPAPVEPVYYAPEPVYYAPPPAPEITAGIGDIPQYMVEDYGLIGGAPDRFTAPQISAEQLAAERYAADQAAQQMEAQRAAAERYAAEQAAAQQAEAQRVAAEQAAAAAEAQRVAAAQELAARAEAERVAAERAAAAEAAAQRQQTELNERRAQAAQAAAERAAQERAFAEQAAAQAAAEAQAAAQAQAEAAAQAEAQRVAAAQAQAEAQAQAQAAEQVRVQAAQQAEAQRVAAKQAQAEQARVQAEAAAAVTPAPEPVFTPEPQLLSGIGRAVDENYYTPEAQAPEQTYTPAPVAAPEADVVRGIGGREVSAEPDYGFAPEQIYAPEPVSAPVYTPAVEPMTVEAEPIMGIGSPFVAETAAAPAAAPAAEQQPMTQEDQYARRIAANTPPPGTSIVGPYAGKKGLSFGKDNTFSVYDEQEVRVVDGKGNVIFTGVGVEGAKRAVAVAQSLSDDLGKNANFKIQKGENTIVDGRVGPNRYIDVARAAPSQSGLGFLADYVLPFAATFIPGVGPVLGAALGSAASSAAQGRGLEDALVRAAIAGGTAGIASGTGLDKAIGGALSNTAGQTAGQVAGQVGAQAVGSAGGDIVVTGLSKALQAAGGALGSAALSQAGNAAARELSGYKTPAEKFADQPLPEALQPPVQPPVDEIVVTAAPRPDAVADVISGIGSSAAADVIPSFETPADRFVQEAPVETPVETPAEDTIVVSGERIPAVADAVTGAVAGIGDSMLTPDDLSVLDRVSDMEKEVEEPYEEIVVTGRDTAVPIVTPDIGIDGGSVTETLPALTPDPALTEKSTLDKIKDAYDIARVGAALLPLIPGGGGGDGGMRSPDTTSLRFTKSPLRPTTPAGGIGGIGEAGGYPYTPQTYGRRGGDQETEYLFFTKDPVTGQELLQSAPAPITTPIANESAGPAMILPSGNTFAEGGEVDDDMVKHLVEYHKNGGHQGPGQVKGIGSGQDDKIPAWLSDGEYVWSAQDVADLGDGSTDEGVRRLDKMRQMVRRQAGRKDVKKIAKPQKGIDTMLKAVGGLV